MKTKIVFLLVAIFSAIGASAQSEFSRFNLGTDYSFSSTSKELDTTYKDNDRFGFNGELFYKGIPEDDQEASNFWGIGIYGNFLRSVVVLDSFGRNFNSWEAGLVTRFSGDVDMTNSAYIVDIHAGYSSKSKTLRTSYYDKNVLGFPVLMAKTRYQKMDAISSGISFGTRKSNPMALDADERWLYAFSVFVDVDVRLRTTALLTTQTHEKLDTIKTKPTAEELKRVFWTIGCEFDPYSIPLPSGNAGVSPMAVKFSYSNNTDFSLGKNWQLEFGPEINSYQRIGKALTVKGVYIQGEDFSGWGIKLGLTLRIADLFYDMDEKKNDPNN
jgi:hypothetical protein